MSKLEKGKKFTYQDYLQFSDTERYELIDGEIFSMVPAPSRQHQKLVTELARFIGNFLADNGGGCELYVAPFDVRLAHEQEQIDDAINIVQPDISIICDDKKLDDQGCIGAPDFIIEVVSPSNPSLDYVKKLYLYEKFKVREYWIVNPESKSILVYSLNQQGYYNEPAKYNFSDNIRSRIFDKLVVSIEKVLG